MIQTWEQGPDPGGNMGEDGSTIAVPNWMADMSDTQDIRSGYNSRITSNARAVRRER